MRKIEERELENPLDNVLLDWADAAVTPLARARITPNQVTYASIIFKAASVWYMRRGQLAPFLLTYIVGVWLDYEDGALARATNQVTKLGDVLDHVSDTAHILGIIAVIVWKLGWRGSVWPLGVIGVFGALSWVHLGCQQRHYRASRARAGKHDDAAEGLDKLQAMCAADDPARWMRVTRWFGVGTFQVVTLAVAAAVVCRTKK